MSSGKADMGEDKNRIDIYEQQLLYMEHVCHIQRQETSRLNLELMRQRDVDGIRIRKLEEKAARLTRLEDKFRKPTLTDYRHDFTYGGRAIYTADQLEAQKNYTFEHPVKFSVIVPVYNTDKTMLNEMICSVLDQTYSNFELCIADGSDSEHAYVEKVCKIASSSFGGRLKYKKINNGGISANSNEALALATGDWIVLLDHDDLLHPAALYCVMRKIEDTGADFVYTDETRFEGIPQNNTNQYPYYKPDYSPEHLRNTNYICHLTAFKKALLSEGEGFRSEFDGSQDHDLVLRLTERASKVEHIPQVLYYWRYTDGSVSAVAAYDSDVYVHGRNAVQAQLDRMGIKGMAENLPDAGYYHVRYEITGNPKVSVIILNRDHRELLERCVNSILTKSTYSNYEIVICENGSTDKDILDYYDELKKEPKVRIANWQGSGEFNYSALNNFGAKNASGDYYLLLNNDTEVISEGWIEELLGLAQREDSGAVGCLLSYPDDTIQHAGISLSCGQSIHRGMYESSLTVGYHGINRCVTDVSAVTGACMMVRKDIWDKLGGLNEEYKVTYNDIDFCLRAREAGYRILYTPFALLYHYEGRSRGFRRTDDADIAREAAEKQMLLTEHPDTVICDPDRNPHYSFEGYYCEYIETQKDRTVARLLEGNREIPLFIDLSIEQGSLSNLYYAADVILDKPEGISLIDIGHSASAPSDGIVALSYSLFKQKDIGGTLIAVLDDMVLIGFGDKVKSNSSDEGGFSVTSGRFIGEGFHTPEANGLRWSSDTKTEMRVLGLKKDSYRFSLIHGYSIPLAELGRQSLNMSIDVNGTHVADIAIDASNNGQDITFDVPAEAMSGGTDVISITTDVWSPSDYGSLDRRTLGYSTGGIRAERLNPEGDL